MVDMHFVIERARSFVRELVDGLSDAGIRLDEAPKWNKYGYIEDAPAQQLRILTSCAGEKSYEISTADLEGASKGYFDAKANLRRIVAVVVSDQSKKA